jgi:uncharacterized membrane protein
VTSDDRSTDARPARTRITVGVVVGLAVAVIAGTLGSWVYAPALGWICGAIVYLTWTWAVVSGMDPGQTANHATREDPPKRETQLLIIGASIASLAGVGYLLVRASSSTGAAQAVAAALGVMSVAVSWVVVHTLFTLRYALLYYTDDNHGVNFKQTSPPRYSDFAYLAFTVGMTFQVSDTDITSHTIRATALRHALLSYLFGSLILAATVNLVASLASSSH